MDAAPLYEEVAGRLQKLIDDGTLRPGARIPSVRRLHRQWSVSISTVLEAYRLLEGRGVIEVRPQSGHFVRAGSRRPLPEPAPSRPPPEPCKVDLSSLAARLTTVSHRADMVKLGGAVPDPALLPTRALTRLFGDVARRAPDAFDYAPTPGRLELRRAVAARLVDAGCALAPDDLVVTNGAQEAVHLALRAVTRPGDAIAIQSPTYWGFVEVLGALDLRAIEVPTHPRDGIDLEHLERAITEGGARAVLLVANFSNPLGSCMSADHKRALVGLATRHGVPVIEDDIYGELPFEGTRPEALKAFDREGQVIHCASVSKTLSPGLRIGWAAPGRYLEAYARLKRLGSLAAPTLGQLVVAEYLQSGAFDRHLRRLRRAYRERVRRVTLALDRFMPRCTRVTRPQGGHVVWVEMPERVDSVRLFEDALRAGITIAPGIMFSPSGRYLNCMRINCAWWDDSTEAAIRTLGERVSRLAE